ncbi:hypothetical protein MML48_1g16315 [Holotrichia oblita]|uniref:Uncharacterized protein n=2 Tax=Holotrichia oblita TaxID=644536 RepID=A0ACB9TXB6_HOLOL|nr:hypothetical protein MML48_1g14589 [Holotrichia oblita]KAI4471252.1 hypothetical protein MML48_1g16315 [Holotrichia oblita]
MDFSTQEVFEFLNLYESEPILWDPKHSSRRNRNEVKQSWERIQRAFSVECSIDLLKKKRDSLMATFRPLIAKVKKSMKLGAECAEIYKPSWFAYEKMSGFLMPIYLSDIEEVDIVETQNVEEDSNHDQEHEHTPSRTIKSPPPQQSKKRKLISTRAVEVQVTDSYQAHKPTEINRQARDSCSVYAELLAMKLREFDEFSRATVMNDIDNLMYRAKMRFCRPSSTHIDPLGNFSTPINSANMSQNIPHSSCESSSATSSEFIEEYTERKLF